MDHADALATVFRDNKGFGSSPLYRHLLNVVADDPELLALAAHVRPEAQPPFVLFGAVHELLLYGARDALADYYPSVVGAATRPPDADTAALFRSFCAAHADELVTLLRTRLVQTNQVQRSFVLRLGLALLARSTDQPVAVVEIGCSAGLNLLVEHYAYEVGDRTFGVLHAPVRIRVDVTHPSYLPDLGRMPALATVVGVDLHPLDPTDEGDRRWLRALVWPENLAQAAQLDAALAIAAAHPPTVLAGDAVDVCRRLAAELPAGMPRLAVHTAVRIYVPEHRRQAFDAAIASLGDDGSLVHLSVEDEHERAPSGREGLALTRTDATGRRTLAVVDPHLSWLEPLAAF